MNEPVTVATGSTLTVDVSDYAAAIGINMTNANQDVAFTNTVAIRRNQDWDVPAGRTLTIGGALTATGVEVDFTGFAGTLGGLGNSNSIIGPWATTGSGTGMKYATVNAGVVSGYTGATDMPVTGGAATANYTVGASKALTANESVNTVQGIGAGGWTISANNLTVNGVMNASSGLLTISSAITAGANRDWSSAAPAT